MTFSWATPAYDGVWPAHTQRQMIGCNRESRPSRGGVSWQAADATRVESIFCPIVVVELVPTGLPADDEVLIQVRQHMYRILENAFDEAGVSWAECRHEGRGDAVIIAVPPYVPAELLLDQLVTRLRAGLRLHNKMSSEIAQIRLMMAVTVGRINFTLTGMTGVALTRLADLLEAAGFSREFAETSTDLGLVTSDYLYDELIQYGPGLIDPATYHPIKVPTGQGHTSAWVYFPPRPTPRLRAASDAA
jgi:hypothetical protein